MAFLFPSLVATELSICGNFLKTPVLVTEPLDKITGAVKLQKDRLGHYHLVVINETAWKLLPNQKPIAERKVM